MATPSVTAATLLARCRTPCPAALADTPVRIAPRWLRLVWRGPFSAITLPWGIYLSDGRPLDWASDGRRLLILHEMVHAEQWRRLGAVRFVIRYVGEYLRGRRSGLSRLDAYSAISLEIEARRRAGA